MRIKQLPYIDWNSPGTMEADRGEWEAEPPLEDLVTDADLPPRLVDVAKTTPYRPEDALLLPAERFSNRPASAWHGRLINAAAEPERTRGQSQAVALRLSRSCSGWEQRPSSNELYEAIRAKTPTQRERAILECWASEADWEELLQAWTEHAYTFRELAAALHRAGLSRCPAAAALNSWAGELNHAIGPP